MKANYPRETERSMDLMFKELDRDHPLPTRGYERQLAETYRKSITDDDGKPLKVINGSEDIAVRNELIAPHLRFVKKRAQFYAHITGQQSRIMDMVNEGGLGLIKAARKFEPDRGYRFVSYAVWWINAYIQNYVMRQGKNVKRGTNTLQRSILGKLNGINGVLAAIDQADRKYYSDRYDLEGFLESWKCTEEQLRSAVDFLASSDYSLDTPLGDAGMQTHLDLLEEEGFGDTPAIVEARSDYVYAKGLIHDATKYVLGMYEPNTHGYNVRADILNHRLLVEYEDRLTLQQIGEKFGLSRERARQIERDIMKKMGRYIARYTEEDRQVIEKYL